MSEASLALLALIWPFPAAWIAFRLFPKALTKFVEKEIEHRSDLTLEAAKADLQGAYSTLKTSVDVITSTNSGMQPDIITSAKALWTSMLLLRGNFGLLIAYDSIVTTDEAGDMFATGAHPQLFEYVRPFQGELHVNPLMVDANAVELDEHRLFCGDRLWMLFSIYRAVILRSAALISWSFAEQRFRDWRGDNGIEQLLSAVISPEQLRTVRDATFGGLAQALTWIEADFLHEATRVMSGSKAMADSLADMQALMLLQNATVKSR